MTYHPSIEQDLAVPIAAAPPIDGARRMRSRQGPMCPCCGTYARDLILRDHRHLGEGGTEAAVLVLAAGAEDRLATQGVCATAILLAKRSALIYDAIYRVFRVAEVSRPL